MQILADIGGTYARFGMASAAGPHHIRKYTASDFPALEEALARYCDEESIKTGGALRIATAGYKDGTVWRFVNQNQWIISSENLVARGWDVELILNDFEAATWALRDLEPQDQHILKAGAGASETSCLLGPGTGLGLGYLVKTAGGVHVQKTHGGHMPVAALTEEQWQVIQYVQSLKTVPSIPVFENFVSGGGLYNLYVAQCKMAGETPEITTPAALLEHKGDVRVHTALRLFHEFFGLFATTAVITGHAYGGVYLTGGVLDRLREHGLFDIEHFLKFFVVEGVASVTRDVRATPVVHVTCPSPALKGLMVAL